MSNMMHSNNKPLPLRWHVNPPSTLPADKRPVPRLTDGLAVAARPFKQAGSVLVISLIILLLMTIVGATAMQTTGLEERMAGNMRDRNIAFQAAESALRAGENFLTQAALPNFTQAGTNGLYAVNGNPPGIYDSWANNTETYAAASDQAAENPRYVIQRMANVASGDSLDAGGFGQSEMYRVTARGVGGTETAVVVVQSTYKR